LSNLSLQKMLYIAQMVHLGKVRRPLIRDDFEAWDYGPVLPAVYHKAKIFGSGPVRNVFRTIEGIEANDDADNWLLRAYNSLIQKNPGELISITHWDKGAWAKNYEPGVRHIVIPMGDILEEYKARNLGN